MSPQKEGNELSDQYSNRSGFSPRISIKTESDEDSFNKDAFLKLLESGSSETIEEPQTFTESSMEPPNDTTIYPPEPNPSPPNSPRVEVRPRADSIESIACGSDAWFRFYTWSYNKTQ